VSGATGTVASTVTGDAFGRVIKSGAGTLVLTGANTYTGATTVNSGTLQVNAASQSPILTGAGADIRSGRVVFDYAGGTAPDVRTLLTASYNGGVDAFQTGQLRSSTATPARTLGWRDDGVSAVTVMYTVNGDANLSGGVTLADVNTAKANFGGNNDVWATGDFNYDGNVTLADINTTKARFGDSLAAPDSAPAAASVASAASASLADVGTNALADRAELVVDVVTGQVRIVGNDADVAEITSYEIGSPSGSIVLANWLSLADQARPGWGELPSTSQLLGEDHGFTADTVNATGFGLGALFKVAGGTQDLRFNYGDENFVTGVGTVTYVPEPGSIGLLAAGAIGLLARRRRA
jgi:autotransporter-associated beta strand protein